MPPTEVTILRELLKSGDTPVSGTRMAKLLGISRVAVWMQLQKLTKQGFAFEVVRPLGYRLTQVPETLNAALVQAHLGRTRAPHLVCEDSVDSTNSEAERRLASGAEAPLVILARAQTAGRGRRGRAWHSPDQGNLYSTFVFRPRLDPSRLQDFTLWMGVVVCELVENFCRISPGLKWPNDLLLGGRKAGGMLTEARVDADEVRDLVFGLGLNVNGRSTEMPAEVRRVATSLAEVCGAPIDLNKFAAALISRVTRGYAEFVSGDYRDRFRTLWDRYDVLRGKPVGVVQGTRTVRGVAEDIDEDGSLLVRTAAGVTERFRAGEVTLAKDAT